ncbi:hypothetical protein [Nocardia otitidiscaviarum]|uniref:hypothetical protein n=1 Tax=Nocardia otitidiscaviarum TaxID=1823 RepID=UPI0018956437|nr:hypothetical protein [Nocardia otitidiscaviarum]MBF6182419.1 hypothetical protein [Nocardia otitidiscaviarum]
MKSTVLRTAVPAAAATLALLVGSPAASAAPTLEVSESSGVAPGQMITVKLAGLPPNLPTVAVGQCTPQITLPTDCQLSGSLMGRADEQGVWQPTGGRELALVEAVGGTDCTAAPGACTVAVTSLTDPSKILASVPLTFGTPETTPPPAPMADADTAEAVEEDSDTGMIVAIVAGGVILAALAAGLLVMRRRGSR